MTHESSESSAYRLAAKMRLELADVHHGPIDQTAAVNLDEEGCGAFVQVWIWVDANDTDLPLCPACAERRLPANQKFCNSCLSPAITQRIAALSRKELEKIYSIVFCPPPLTPLSDNTLRERIQTLCAYSSIDEDDFTDLKRGEW